MPSATMDMRGFRRAKLEAELDRQRAAVLAMAARPGMQPAKGDRVLQHGADPEDRKRAIKILRTIGRGQKVMDMRFGAHWSVLKCLHLWLCRVPELAKSTEGGGEVNLGVKSFVDGGVVLCRDEMGVKSPARTVKSMVMLFSRKWPVLTMLRFDDSLASHIGKFDSIEQLHKKLPGKVNEKFHELSMSRILQACRPVTESRALNKRMQDVVLVVQRALNRMEHSDINAIDSLAKSSGDLAPYNEVISAVQSAVGISGLSGWCFPSEREIRRGVKKPSHVEQKAMLQQALSVLEQEVLPF